MRGRSRSVLALALCAVAGCRGDSEPDRPAGSPLDRGADALVECLDEAAADPLEMVGRTGVTRAAGVRSRTVTAWLSRPPGIPVASHYVPVFFHVTDGRAQARRLIRVARASAELVGSRGAVVFDAEARPPPAQRQVIGECSRRAARAHAAAGVDAPTRR